MSTAIISLLSSSDFERPNVVKMGKAEAIDLVSSSEPMEEHEKEFPKLHSANGEHVKRLRESRMGIMLSYAKHKDSEAHLSHYEAAVEWHRELQQLAEAFVKSGEKQVAVHKDPPLLYDDSVCQGCHMLHEKTKSKAFDDANDDLSALPHLFHVYLQDAPKNRPPNAPSRCFSVCYVRDQETPRTTLATHDFAVLCGPCATLRLAVLKYLVEYSSSTGGSLLMHWEDQQDVHDDHASIERAIDNWFKASGLL